MALPQNPGPNPNPPLPVLPPPVKGPGLPWEGVTALGLGVLLYWSGALQGGIFLMGVGMLWCLLSRAGALARSSPSLAEGPSSLEKGLTFAGWTGFALLCVGTLSQPNLLWAAPSFLTLTPKGAVWFMLAGGALLFLCFLKAPSREAQDWPVGTSRFLLLAILGLALALRFYRLGEIPSHYWDDWGEELIDARDYLDHGGPRLIYPLGHREPFFHYFTAYLWEFMPHAPGLVVQRLSSSLQDFLTILLLYFVGKGFGGRRIGLFAAALAAVNKPLLTMDLVGIHLISLSLAVGLSIFALFRVVDRPTWGRFLFLGSALGAGIYTYSAFRPWLPFMVFSLLAWALARGEERPVTPLRWGLAGLTCFSLLLTYLMVNPFMSRDSFLGQLAAMPSTKYLLAALVGVLLYRTYREALASGKGMMTVRWALATLWAFLLASPILFQEALTRRMGGLAIFDPAKGYDLSFFLRLLNSFLESLGTMFVRGRDRGDFSIPYDVYLDYPAQVFIFLGLAYFLARPDWRTIFLLLAAAVGMSPHVLSSDPHSGKMLGTIFPLLLVAGLGADRLWSTLSQAPGTLRMAGTAFLVAVWAWGGWLTFDRLYLQWAFVKPASNAALAKECVRVGPGRPVFMSRYSGSFGSGPTQKVLQEGNGTRILANDNPIFLSPQEPVPDVTVVLSQEDKENRARIQAEYPGARWTEILRYPPFIPSNPPVVERVEIPGVLVGETPGKLFRIQRTAPGEWRRSFHEGGYGALLGNVISQESLRDPRAPFPSSGNTICRLQGVYLSPAKGRRKFRVTTHNPFKLIVGGKVLMDLKPKKETLKGSKSISLPAGEIPVEMIIYLKTSQELPIVAIEGPSGQPDGTL